MKYGKTSEKIYVCKNSIGRTTRRLAVLRKENPDQRFLSKAPKAGDVLKLNSETKKFEFFKSEQIVED